jgi:hypothetical protein
LSCIKTISSNEFENSMVNSNIDSNLCTLISDISVQLIQYMDCIVVELLNSEYLAHLLRLVQWICTMVPGSSTLLRNDSSTSGARLLSFFVVVQESPEIHDLRIFKGKQTWQRTSRGLLERQADSAMWRGGSRQAKPGGRRGDDRLAKRSERLDPLHLESLASLGVRRAAVRHSIADVRGEEAAGRPSQEGGRRESCGEAWAEEEWRVEGGSWESCGEAWAKEEGRAEGGSREWSGRDKAEAKKSFGFGLRGC